MATVAAPVEEQRRTDETALITGSEAIAVACKLADVDVITAYPIRPYDTVMQYVCKLVANGEMDCEYIVAEGELLWQQWPHQLRNSAGLTKPL